jgi:hypothetical protein
MKEYHILAQKLLRASSESSIKLLVKNSNYLLYDFKVEAFESIEEGISKILVDSFP